jgi:hypothetical protein
MKKSIQKITNIQVCYLKYIFFSNQLWIKIKGDSPIELKDKNWSIISLIYSENWVSR